MGQFRAELKLGVKTLNSLTHQAMNLTNYRVRFPCKTFKHLINPTYKSKCFCTLCLGVNTLNGSLTFQQQQQQLFQNSCVLLSPSYQFLPLSEAPFFTCLTQFFARRYLLVYSISLSLSVYLYLLSHFPM